jgi:hypothetical protein
MSQLGKVKSLGPEHRYCREVRFRAASVLYPLHAPIPDDPLLVGVRCVEGLQGLSRLTNSLRLDDLRSGLGDAAFYEIGLNFELLLRAQVHHGVEGQVAG